MILRPSRAVRTLAFSLGLASFATPALAQPQPTIATVDPHVKATVEASPPKIRLTWQTLEDVSALKVRRRPGATGNHAAGQWKVVADGLAADATSFEDTDVAPGQFYEYHVARSGTVSDGNAWVLSGIDAPFVEDPGVVAVVADASLSSAANVAIDRLVADLRAEGWDVERIAIAKTATPPELKTQLQALRAKHGARFRSAILLGGVPRAFSGVVMPDGHFDHEGAWPADAYYGDLDGTWNDTDGPRGVGVFKNAPGDGKFDPTFPPTDVDIAVGRIDTEKLPAFAPLTASDLLVRYLDANHAFRTGAKTYAERTWVTDTFGFAGGEAFGRIGYRDGAAIFGKAPETGQPFLDALDDDAGYLLAFGSGAGGPKSAAGVATTSDFVTRAPKAVVMGLFGSYFGDWSYDDNLMRAALVSPSPALATFWFGRPQYHVHALGALRTLGEAHLATQNDLGRSYTAGGPSSVHLALLGDPTLRLFVTRPPSALVATPVPTGVTLAWGPSPDLVAGYHVYRRAKDATGAWTRLTMTPLTTTTYTDYSAAMPAEHDYRVVAVRLRTTGSGRFIEHSGGPIVRAMALPPAPPPGDAGSDASAPSPDGGPNGPIGHGDASAEDGGASEPSDDGGGSGGCRLGRSDRGAESLAGLGAIVVALAIVARRTWRRRTPIAQ